MLPPALLIPTKVLIIENTRHNRLYRRTKQKRIPCNTRPNIKRLAIEIKKALETPCHSAIANSSKKIGIYSAQFACPRNTRSNSFRIFFRRLRVAQGNHPKAERHQPQRSERWQKSTDCHGSNSGRVRLFFQLFVLYF